MIPGFLFTKPMQSSSHSAGATQSEKTSQFQGRDILPKQSSRFIETFKKYMRILGNILHLRDTTPIYDKFKEKTDNLSKLVDIFKDRPEEGVSLEELVGTIQDEIFLEQELNQLTEERTFSEPQKRALTDTLLKIKSFLNPIRPTPDTLLSLAPPLKLKAEKDTKQEHEDLAPTPTKEERLENAIVDLEKTVQKLRAKKVILNFSRTTEFQDSDPGNLKSKGLSFQLLTAVNELSEKTKLLQKEAEQFLPGKTAEVPAQPKQQPAVIAAKPTEVESSNEITYPRPISLNSLTSGCKSLAELDSYIVRLYGSKGFDLVNNLSGTPNLYVKMVGAKLFVKIKTLEEELAKFADSSPLYLTAKARLEDLKKLVSEKLAYKENPISPKSPIPHEVTVALRQEVFTPGRVFKRVIHNFSEKMKHHKKAKKQLTITVPK